MWTNLSPQNSEDSTQNKHELVCVDGSTCILMRTHANKLFFLALCFLLFTSITCVACAKLLTPRLALSSIVTQTHTRTQWLSSSKYQIFMPTMYLWTHFVIQVNPPPPPPPPQEKRLRRAHKVGIFSVFVKPDTIFGDCHTFTRCAGDRLPVGQMLNIENFGKEKKKCLASMTIW